MFSKIIRENQIVIDCTAVNILRDAAVISAGDTGKHIEHGTPERTFSKLGELWTLYLSMRRDPRASITGSEAAVMLSLLKVCRMTMGVPTRDHFVDGANYLALAGEEALRTTQPETTPRSPLS